MVKNKRGSWSPADIFAIPLTDGRFALAQVLDQRLPNTVRIAIYSDIINSTKVINLSLVKENLISLMEVTKIKLDKNEWKIIDNQKTSIPISMYPNEQYRSNNWINSVVHDAAVAESFCYTARVHVPSTTPN